MLGFKISDYSEFKLDLRKKVVAGIAIQKMFSSFSSDEIHKSKLVLVVFLAMTACSSLAITDVRNIANNVYRRGVRDPGVIRDYLESHWIRKLHLGAGGNDPTEWLNTDIFPTGEEVYVDATKPFPFPDGSFQYVFSEHMIQAVPWEGGLAMLKECYRVLAPGGKLRIVSPNLEKFVQLLRENPDATQSGSWRRRCDSMAGLRGP